RVVLGRREGAEARLVAARGLGGVARAAGQGDGAERRLEVGVPALAARAALAGDHVAARDGDVRATRAVLLPAAFDGHLLQRAGGRVDVRLRGELELAVGGRELGEVV